MVDVLFWQTETTVAAGQGGGEAICPLPDSRGGGGLRRRDATDLGDAQMMMRESDDHKCYLYLDVLRVRPAFCTCSVSHAFAVCHKIWPYRRDFVAANLPEK